MSDPELPAPTPPRSPWRIRSWPTLAAAVVVVTAVVGVVAYLMSLGDDGAEALSIAKTVNKRLDGIVKKIEDSNADLKRIGKTIEGQATAYRKELSEDRIARATELGAAAAARKEAFAGMTTQLRVLHDDNKEQGIAVGALRTKLGKLTTAVNQQNNILKKCYSYIVHDPLKSTGAVVQREFSRLSVKWPATFYRSGQLKAIVIRIRTDDLTAEDVELLMKRNLQSVPGAAKRELAAKFAVGLSPVRGDYAALVDLCETAKQDIKDANVPSDFDAEQAGAFGVTKRAQTERIDKVLKSAEKYVEVVGRAIEYNKRVADGGR